MYVNFVCMSTALREANLVSLPQNEADDDIDASDL